MRTEFVKSVLHVQLALKVFVNGVTYKNASNVKKELLRTMVVTIHVKDARIVTVTTVTSFGHVQWYKILYAVAARLVSMKIPAVLRVNAFLVRKAQIIQNAMM